MVTPSIRRSMEPYLTLLSYYGDGGQVYPLGSDSYIIGLCTGLLASAAVSSSRTVGELIPVAIEAVVVALRLGLCALKVRDFVGQNEAGSQSWSAVLSGIQEDQALVAIREFSKQKVGLSVFYSQRTVV
jgi:naphtho-gamma-pyrone polyketide synthase